MNHKKINKIKESIISLAGSLSILPKSMQRRHLQRMQKEAGTTESQRTKVYAMWKTDP